MVCQSLFTISPMSPKQRRMNASADSYHLPHSRRKKWNSIIDISGDYPFITAVSIAIVASVGALPYDTNFTGDVRN